MPGWRGIITTGYVVAIIAAFECPPVMFPPRRIRHCYPPCSRRSTYQLQHGKRECARRRRQIAAGSLRTANGLAT